MHKYKDLQKTCRALQQERDELSRQLKNLQKTLESTQSKLQLAVMEKEETRHCAIQERSRLEMALGSTQKNLSTFIEQLGASQKQCDDLQFDVAIHQDQYNDTLEELEKMRRSQLTEKDQAVTTQANAVQELNRERDAPVQECQEAVDAKKSWNKKWLV